MTLIRPFGNIGDELIWAGTRELLRGHVYREIGVDELPSASGELAVISGGGAWSRRYNEFMPEALAIAELRFERVIVLPSTFEVAEDRVRAALETTDAPWSSRASSSRSARSSGLCRARLAHDCAFFADSQRRTATPARASSTPSASTTRACGLRALPAGQRRHLREPPNRSTTGCARSSATRCVNTDRAHVMIAAALMGKTGATTRRAVTSRSTRSRSSRCGDYDVAPLAEPTCSRRRTVRRQCATLGVAHRLAGAQATVAVISRDQRRARRARDRLGPQHERRRPTAGARPQLAAADPRRT